MDSNRTNALLRHMPVVDAYGQRLAALQNVWDSLSLLSQMSGDGTSMDRTREAFESLSRELVKQLSAETARTAVLELQAKAQVAIDIMVRNLFERTADIGFLCIDDDIVQFMQSAAQNANAESAVNALRKRLQEYVAKYSVYQNVLLLDVNGKLLVQLDERNDIAQSCDPLIAKTLSTDQAYVESYGGTDLVASGEPALIYSYRVQTQQTMLGVLCLCFRIRDETNAIFNKLRNEDDWSVLALLDTQGRVIASSDEWQLPLGAPQSLALEDEGRVVRFAGREYLAITRATQGYQGYMGPGWYAHAMVPLEHAFERRSSQVLTGIDRNVLGNVRRTAQVFSAQLRAIPERADHIQRDLNQSVWNGNVRLSVNSGKENAFSKSLLREISTTGRRTKDVFDQSIGDLHETVVSALLHDSCFRASLAVEIMDRNLYERANDCRWWALNGTLRNCLSGAADVQTAGKVLENINSLYTVYDSILLFDRDGRVLASSNPKRRQLCGKLLTQAWARETLALRDTQAFAVSAFEPFNGYDDKYTYIFGAAVRGQDDRVMGGIAVVFDSEPQFAAMLRDVVPLESDGSIADTCCTVLVDAQGKVISATSRYRAGERLQLSEHLLKPPASGAADIVTIDGHYFAVGSRRCAGYREFKGAGATAVVMTALGEVQEQQLRQAASFHFTRHSHHSGATIDLAVVSSGEHWLAIPKEHVVEAIEAAAITRVPGRAAWLSGVIKYQGAMLPVLDLAYWTSNGEHTRMRSVVVLRHEQKLLGLGVDQLGEVLEVTQDEIAKLDALQAGLQYQLTPHVVRSRHANDSALLLLDVSVLKALIAPPSIKQSA